MSLSASAIQHTFVTVQKVDNNNIHKKSYAVLAYRDKLAWFVLLWNLMIQTVFAMYRIIG